MKTFSYYPSRKITLNGKKLQIEPYRVAEIRDYVAPMDGIGSQLANMMAKLSLLTEREEPLTLEEIDQVTEMTEKANALKLEAMDISYKLAQLGLKRALYPLAYDKIGEELDEFPDVGISQGQAPMIVGVMTKLANKDIPQVADTKKALKQKLQEKSGRATTDGLSE